MKTEADEKASCSSKKGSDVDLSSSFDIDYDPAYSYQEQRTIIHRIDRRLVVALGLLYCMSQIDRGNMDNASVAGSEQQKDLAAVHISADPVSKKV